MKKKIMSSLFCGVLAVLLILVMGGCGRKHIVSSPPTKQVERLPAPKVEVVPEKPGLIEETYIVDAPEEAAPAAIIKEGELDAEPVAASATIASPEVVAQPVVVQTTPQKAEAKADPQGDIYYVQIGAFSDLENANRALARILSDGYKGSKLSRTEDGLFRVQAGTFPDKVSAEEALSKLLADYPKGFILSNLPKK